MEDVETDVEDTGQAILTDGDGALILILLVSFGVVALAFWLYAKQVGMIGVGVVGAATTPFVDLFDGIGTFFTDLFNGIGKALSNLFIMPIAMVIGKEKVRVRIRKAILRMHKMRAYLEGRIRRVGY